MTFAITEDMEAVREILTAPECYRRMANDQAPLAENLPVRPAQGITYVLASDGKGPGAVFLLVTDRTPGTAEVHFCFHPDLWGKAQEISEQFLKWVWKTTSLKRLLGPVPSYNRLALRLARAVGFADSEIHVGAVKKRGKEHDLLILELVRPVAKAATK